MGVTLGIYGATDASGWTTFTASVDTNIIYVSTSGVDAPGNGTLANPVATLNYAVTNSTIGTLGVGLRDGFPDRVLLKKGDTWVNDKFAFVSASGRSATEPQIFGSYDPAQAGVVNPSVNKARPQINGLWDAGTFPILGALHAGEGNYRAVVGINFDNYTVDPGNVSYNASNITHEFGAISANGNPNWMLIEDCKFNFFGVGFGSSYGDDVTQAAFVNLYFRRNIICNAYATSGNVEGFFLNGITNPVVEENIFDHNGWNASVVGADRTLFNHNVYVGCYNGPILYRGNINTRASNIGSQLRSGGTILDNFHSQNPVGVLVRTSLSSVRNNVVSEGITTGIAGIGNSWGYSIRGSGDGTLIDSNVLSNTLAAPADFSILIDTAAIGAQVSITLANPAVLTLYGNVQSSADIFVQNGNAVTLTTTGALPSSIVSGTTYYVVNASASGLIFNIATTKGGAAISTLGQSQSGTPSITIGTQNDVVQNNIIYHWLGAPTDNGISTTLSGNTVDGGSYPDPSRTIGSYAATLGLTATLDGFMASALAMNKDTWNPALTATAINNYIRAGFGIGITGRCRNLKGGF